MHPHGPLRPVQLKTKVTEQSHELRQVKSLAMQLEGAREIQGEQLRQVEANRQAVERAQAAAQEELVRAKQGCSDREAEVQDLQRALSRLDEERDLLQVCVGSWVRGFVCVFRVCATSLARRLLLWPPTFARTSSHHLRRATCCL